jgi:hypothetical protein
MPRRSRRAWIAAIAFAAMGGALLVFLVHRTDEALLARTVAHAARWLPVLLCLEGVRVAVEAWGSRHLYARPIPFGQLLRANIVGYAVSALAPAGRATAEGVKAGMLARFTGVSDTAAAATTNQSASLLAIGLMSAVCAVAGLTVSRALAVTFAVNAVIACAVSAAVSGVARTGHLGRLLGRFFPKGRAALDAVRANAVRQGMRAPLVGFIVGRVLQLAEYALALVAITGHAGFTRSLSTFGVAMVGGSLGDSIPAQIGVSDASFAAAAQGLGISTEDALTIALLAHMVQLAWIVFGLLTPLVWHPSADVSPPSVPPSRSHTGRPAPCCATPPPRSRGRSPRRSPRPR